jgi:DcaP outer membrane protein
MRKEFEARRPGGFLRLALGALVVFIGVNDACAQAQTPTAPTSSAWQSVSQTVSSKTDGPSQVFPEGGFPNYPPAPEGGISPSPDAPQPGPWISSTTQQPPSADYAPPGLQPRDVQDAPGTPEFKGVFANPLPDYYYQPSYYNQPGIGARPLADYAPPGYIPREWHDAPGAAEFTPITAPIPITDEEREKFVTRGMFPGSLMVPGTDTSFRLRGFVRFTGLYDFDPIGTRDDFVTNTIPAPQKSGENANASARFSRIGIDTWTPTSIYDWNVHTFIEGDFFNGPGQAVGGGGNPFRLRFAFVDFGYFRLGQQNTVFMDGTAFPSTVDFAGPRGLVNQRRPGARVTVPLTDNLFWAAGVEQPFSDITTNGLGAPVQDIPDFASHLRYESDVGSVQLSTLARSIGYQPTDGDVDRKLGWGVSASTVFHPWAILTGANPLRSDNPTGLERSRVLLQYTVGYGIGRYIQDTAGLGLDGQVNPATGAFSTLYATGWSASYEHWFTEKWLSNITYSQDNVGNAPNQPGSTYVGAKYLAVSLWYIPIRNMSIGAEYLWGIRENLDGEKGQANRANALIQYNF